VARIGLLGGTFNPPHIGHLVMAQEALTQLDLDRVDLVPVHTPPHKEAMGDPGPQTRLELTRAAVGDDPRFVVNDVEVRRGGPSFTVDTLDEIHATNPGDELTFIVGGDQALALPTWREPERVLSLARVAVGEREGVRRHDIATRLAEVASPERVVFFDMPRLDVSSSVIRRRVAEGRPVRWLVPDAVARAIETHRLYRGVVVPPSGGSA
jgi:nicotinate-nucleotide adenylyltransferase